MLAKYGLSVVPCQEDEKMPKTFVNTPTNFVAQILMIYNMQLELLCETNPLSQSGGDFPAIGDFQI